MSANSFHVAAVAVGRYLAMTLIATGCGGGSDADDDAGSMTSGGTSSVGQGGLTTAAGQAGSALTTGGSSAAGTSSTAGTFSNTAGTSTGTAGASTGGASGSGSGGSGSAGSKQGGEAGSGTVSSGGSGGSAAGGSSGSPSTSGGASGASNSGSCGNVTPISKSTCTAGESNCFSFFVASRARMFKLAQAFNGSTKGWGGDFRYGTADGLTGADKLCTEIAEESLPGNCRTWRAFLSTSKVNAISRVGSGPWYDRLNRTIANNLTELVATRPGGITVSSILNNLPNEDGTPHHSEEADCSNANSCADNHDVLTGSDTDGKACTSTTCAGFGGGFPGGGGKGGGGSSVTVTDWTCQDWTLGTSMSGVVPRCGHTWPTMTSGTDDWISHLNESGCAPGFNLVQNGGPMANGNGSVGDGGGYGAIYCLALSE